MIKNWKWTGTVIKNQFEWQKRLMDKYLDELEDYLENYDLSDSQKREIESQVTWYFLSGFAELPINPIALDFIFFIRQKDGWSTALTDTGEWVIILKNKELVK